MPKKKDRTLIEPPVSKYAAKRAARGQQTAEPARATAHDNWPRGLSSYERERIARSETASFHGREPGHKFTRGD